MKAYAPLLCPHCGSPISELRFGVYMRPLWQRIVDAIVRAGPDGITGSDLRGVIYGDRIVTRQAIYVHVHMINAALEGTDYRIRGGSGNGAVYRMVRRSREAA